MAATLDDRAALLRRFYALLDSSSDDEAIGEHDTESEESALHFVQQGLWSAQHWYATVADPYRWVTTVDPVTWTGSADTGLRTALPSDFFRLVGDARESAFYHKGTGARWGRRIMFEERARAAGLHAYYLRNESIHLPVKTAAPDASFVYDYMHRHAVLSAADTEIDFPLEARPLIAAFAAYHAMAEAWPAVNQEDIERNLLHWKHEVADRGRRTQEPHRLRPPRRAARSPNALL